jgi:hypothetical protein
MAQQLFFALRREVDDLVHLQIQVLTQQVLLSPFQLHDCHTRFERIMAFRERWLASEKRASWEAPRGV